MRVIDVNTIPTINCQKIEENTDSIVYYVEGEYNGIVFDQEFVVPTGYAACFDVNQQQLYISRIELNNINDIILAI